MTNRKGSAAPAHVWIDAAGNGFECEGLNPLTSPRERYFAVHHEHISRGQRFLRKRWVMEDGTEFTSRHCVACGVDIERSLGLKNGNHGRRQNEFEAAKHGL